MDAKRKDQLVILEDLLRDCRDINAGSNVLERLTRIIQAAELLSKTDYRSCEPSFFEYIVARLHETQGK